MKIQHFENLKFRQKKIIFSLRCPWVPFCAEISADPKIFRKNFLGIGEHPQSIRW